MILRGTIGAHGEVTIPQAIRDHFQLKEGEHVNFFIRNDNFVISPIKKSFLDYQGIIKVDGEQDFAAIRAHVRRMQAERINSNE